MRSRVLKLSKTFYVLCGVLALVLALPFVLPVVLSWQEQALIAEPAPFPVTVDLANKTIIEDPDVEKLLSEEHSLLAAAAAAPRGFLRAAALAFSNAPWYRLVAGAAGPAIVMVEPGYRKEQAAQAFDLAPSELPLAEGTLYPGAYVVAPGANAEDITAMLAMRFEKRIAKRYATSTAEVVPLIEALTIASMIEREAGSVDEMRLISGVIWNRIFAGMRLQIDATLQYAKGTARNGWWPIVRSRDKYLISPYNTYRNAGLPPAPIANPSVAAILAALNPKKTGCFYYFHDARREFHCSATYEEHIALLKKYYGRGR